MQGGVGEAPSIRSREDQSVNKFGVLATKTRSLVAVSWRGASSQVDGDLVSSVTACALVFISLHFFQSFVERQWRVSLFSPMLWNNFFHSQDDLSWQIGFSGRLASWPRKVHFLTSVSSSCWQANATNPSNKTSTGFRIRRGNGNDRRIIRCEVCPTSKSRPRL